MRGDIAGALAEFREQYDGGADPASILVDLADFTHLVTRVKIVPAVADDPALVEAERGAARELASTLAMRVLARAWQMLSQGHRRGQRPRPAGAGRRDGAGAPRLRRRSADPGRGAAPAVRAVGPGRRRPAVPAGNGGNGARAQRFGVVPASAQAMPQVAAMPAAQAEPTMALASFEDLVALAAAKRDIRLKIALETGVRLVAFQDGRLEIALAGRLALDHRRAGREAEELDRAALGGDAVARGRRADPAPSSARPRSRAAARRHPRPIRWCGPRWRAFPAPRSSPCGAIASAPAADLPPLLIRTLPICRRSTMKGSTACSAGPTTTLRR